MTMASASLFKKLVILLATLALIAPSLAYNILYAGNTLDEGQSLTEGSYNLIMQSDCNLVLYDNGRAVWASGTSQRAIFCYLRLNNDGNLVIIGQQPGEYGTQTVWRSNTGYGQGNYILVMQPDRNVVIYGYPIWATGTNVYGTANVIKDANSTEPVVVASGKISKVTDTEK